MALENGFFKMHRALIRSNIWLKSTPNQCKVLTTILSMVNFGQRVAEFNGNAIVVEAGQVITSLEEIAVKCGKGIKINHVRSALTRFKKLKFITVETTNRGSLITVSEFETYVDTIIDNHKQSNKEITNEVQAEHKSAATNKNLNKERIREEERETPPEVEIEQTLIDFYYKSSPNELDMLVREANYKGSKKKIPFIIKKFSNHHYAKKGTILPFPQIRAAFKIWLMHEKDFDRRTHNEGQKKTINFSKIINKK